MKNAELAAAMFELHMVGVKPQVERGSKHVKIRWEANGKQRTYVCGSTASDYRAALNVRADVRRLIRQDGLKAPENNVVSFRRIMELPEVQEPLAERLARLEGEIGALVDLLLDKPSTVGEPPFSIEITVNGKRVGLEPLPQPATQVALPVASSPIPEAALLASGRFRSLTGAPARVFAILGSGPLRVSEISHRLCLDQRRVGAVLANLNARGLVDRVSRGEWRRRPGV